MTLIKTTILLSYYFKCYFILCTGIIAILYLVLHQNFAKSINQHRTLITTTILLLYYLQKLGFFKQYFCTKKF